MANSGKALGGVAAVLTIAVLLGLAWHSQHVLTANLPPKVICENELDAMVKCSEFVREHDGIGVRTSGTPSMAPFIVGRAWVALVDLPLAQIPDGSLIAYTPFPNTVRPDGTPFPKGSMLLHVLASRDADGGIPTGLNNAKYENWGRVTDGNLVGVALRVFVWPQEAKK